MRSLINGVIGYSWRLSHALFPFVVLKSKRKKRVLSKNILIDNVREEREGERERKKLEEKTRKKQVSLPVC